MATMANGRMSPGLHQYKIKSAHVSLNLLNKLRKIDKMRGLLSIFFFATSLINSIIQEYKC